MNRRSALASLVAMIGAIVAARKAKPCPHADALLDCPARDGARCAGCPWDRWNRPPRQFVEQVVAEAYRRPRDYWVTGVSVGTATVVATVATRTGAAGTPTIFMRSDSTCIDITAGSL